jgi:hypothetical protein
MYLNEATIYLSFIVGWGNERESVKIRGHCKSEREGTFTTFADGKVSSRFYSNPAMTRAELNFVFSVSEKGHRQPRPSLSLSFVNQPLLGICRYTSSFYTSKDAAKDPQTPKYEVGHAQCPSIQRFSKFVELYPLSWLD